MTTTSSSWESHSEVLAKWAQLEVENPYDNAERIEECKRTAAAAMPTLATHIHRMQSQPSDARLIAAVASVATYNLNPNLLHDLHAARWYASLVSEIANTLKQKKATSSLIHTTTPMCLPPLVAATREANAELLTELSTWWMVFLTAAMATTITALGTLAVCSEQDYHCMSVLETAASLLRDLLADGDLVPGAGKFSVTASLHRRGYSLALTTATTTTTTTGGGEKRERTEEEITTGITKGTGTPLFTRRRPVTL
eukprot:PhM_4_TR9384/c0_g1_i1/m.11276